MPLYNDDDLSNLHEIKKILTDWAGLKGHDGIVPPIPSTELESGDMTKGG